MHKTNTFSQKKKKLTKLPQEFVGVLWEFAGVFHEFLNAKNGHFFTKKKEIQKTPTNSPGLLTPTLNSPIYPTFIERNSPGLSTPTNSHS